MFDFKKFSKVGDMLSKHKEESFTRSAIGRYYYSIFCSTRQYLVETKNKKYFLKRKNIHKEVCEELMKSNDLTENEIGEILEQLREIRNQADYDWLTKDGEYYEKSLIQAKNESEKALESLDALKKSPPYEL